MAEFDPPFSDSDVDLRRLPTIDEQQFGFPCGPADRRLFNGLIHRLEGNIGHIAGEAGETPNADDDLTLLYRAVMALISAATGGNPAGYVLMSQARARLPVFPEVLNTDGVIICTSTGAANVRLPGGVSFLHRGIYQETTVQTDFVTVANKTYHLRWSSTTGYALKDLADVAYNPSVLAETNVAFDSTYDSMLIARAVTNSGNIPTITNLANKARLIKQEQSSGPVTLFLSENGAQRTAGFQLNWSRTPVVQATMSLMAHDPSSAVALGNDQDLIVAVQSLTRYQVTVLGLRDYSTDNTIDLLAVGI